MAGIFDFALAAAAFEFKVPGTDAEEVDGGGGLASPFSVSQDESVEFIGHPGVWSVEEEAVQEEMGS